MTRFDNILRKALHLYEQTMVRPPKEQEIIDRIRYHIVRGNSMLRDPLRSGNITMDDIIIAISKNRCIRAKDRDIGSTNTETIVSTAIRELYGDGDLNYIRKIFKLDPIDHLDS